MRDAVLIEVQRLARDGFRRTSLPALVLAVACFAASLTPSLLPRTYWMQGLLSGVAFSFGYAVGVAASRLWKALELPHLPGRLDDLARAGVAILCPGLAVVVLWHSAGWQNGIRALMEMEPVDTAHPFRVGAIAALIFTLLTSLMIAFGGLWRFLVRRLKPHVPRPVAKVLGTVAAVALAWSIINGAFFQVALRLADSSFRELDEHIDEGQPVPTASFRTGGPTSLISWRKLGARGRQFIASGPDKAAIEATMRGPALEPLRVYVGLNSRDTVEDRATLALNELIRVRAFERSVLVVIVPTGTGWIDPGATDTLEYLHRGDVASVALQYSYLSSVLSLLVEPGYGMEAGRALFAKVYDHWTTLPRASRPRLYLHGLSLGALNSEISTDLYDVIADPFEGALWAGPPFQSSRWRQFTRERAPGSPAWLPRFRDGSIIRFMGARGARDPHVRPWGPMRIVYLQYASDPITFFDVKSWYREPDWMREPRGPDVSPNLRWFPIVTMLQLLVDTMASTTAPVGHGHVYAPSDYLEAWIETTDPPALDPVTRERLLGALGHSARRIPQKTISRR